MKGQRKESMRLEQGGLSEEDSSIDWFKPDAIDKKDQLNDQYLIASPTLRIELDVETVRQQKTSKSKVKAKV